MGNCDPSSKLRQLVFVAALLFLFCGYLSWVELRYALHGQTAAATVTRADVYVVHSKGAQTRLAIEYRFAESSGAARSETDDLPKPDTVPTAGSTVQVEYIPGMPGTSRLVGHDHRVEVIVYLLVIAGGLVCLSFYNSVRRSSSPNDALVFDGVVSSSATKPRMYMRGFD